MSGPSRRLGCIVLVIASIAVVVAGSGILWFWQLTEEGGMRLTPATPGVGLVVAGPAPLTRPSPDLADAGVRVRPTSPAVHAEQVMLVMRHRFTLGMWLSAGTHSLDTASLCCVLLDSDGQELGVATIEPATVIEPGRTVSTQLVHPRLPDAAWVEVRKLP